MIMISSKSTWKTVASKSRTGDEELIPDIPGDKSKVIKLRMLCLPLQINLIISNQTAGSQCLEILYINRQK